MSCQSQSGRSEDGILEALSNTRVVCAELLFIAAKHAPEVMWLSGRNAIFGRWCQGDSDVADKLFFIAVVSILACLAPVELRAADPAFCTPYAKAALVQVRGALANSGCGASLQGARWSTDFSTHYEWCLGASQEAAGAERDARTKYGKACARRHPD